MNPYRHIIIGILLLCIIHGHAEDMVSVRFVSFPKATIEDVIELRTGANQSIEVNLPTNSISKAVLVPRLNEWSLGRSTTDKEGNFRFESYGKAPVIAPKEQIVIVVRKGGKNGDGLQLMPMDGGEKGFVGGSYLLRNATKIDLAGTIGDGRFGLKPGQNSLIQPGPSKVKGLQKYCYATIYFRRGEEAEPFFSSTWRYSEKARSMVIFYQDPTTQQLRLHTIRDYVR